MTDQLESKQATPPRIIFELVERFERQLQAYRSGKYNETQLRREFVDPFWEALGWDVNNRKGYAEAYKDVIHEDAIKVGGATKAPDYCFRIGGTRKFFLEAKKPSVNIKGDIAPAFQLRRYAWSARLPLSVLTDFEEFAVYDSRTKPVKTDKASTGRILYLTYSEYINRWNEIASVFSRQEVLKGSFDAHAESNKDKRGTAEVDVAFLKEIEAWREALARHIALRNPQCTQRELNFAVQMIIDRIIFLRICEDRAIEPYGKLATLQNGAQVYRRLLELFRQADDRYNSGLFHFHAEKRRLDPPDDLTPNLDLDDKPLKQIINALYYPESPYEFSVLPADLLGQVYERFLGKVIRLTAGHRAVIEDKPEVKKAGGVFYTPTYIVDYIVRQTVGRFLEEQKPKTLQGGLKLKVLDPACGSGSFLLGAYQYLLDWHLQWYTENKREKWAKGRSPALHQTQGGDWRLTTTERKRILLDHMFGVDIDPQAVEVTKLSLLLKVLEGENDQTLVRQLTMFRERALPDLACNIKCGNSLIGSEFYNQQPMASFSDDERYQLNVFDWRVEFPEIMHDGGFDAVIGNPPYVRQELLSKIKDYLAGHYEVYHGVADLYVYFIERGVELLREGGRFAYIVANKWTRANYGGRLRSWLKRRRLEEIIDFGDLPVFQTATTYPCILCLRKSDARSKFQVTQVKSLDFNELDEVVHRDRYLVDQTALDDRSWSLIGERAQALLDKLREQGVPLGDYVKGKVHYGIKTGLNDAFVIDAATRERLLSKDPKSAELIKPFLIGRDIKRYRPPQSERYLIFTRRGVMIKDYPAIERYLYRFKERLMPKPKDWKGVKWPGRKPGPYHWYEIQDTVAYHEEFEKPKIIIPAIVQRASYTFDTEGFYSNDKTSIIVTDDFYLLGVLNSRLADFVIHSISSTKQGGYFEYKPMYVQQIPIRAVEACNPAEVDFGNRIVDQVKAMLELQKQLQTNRIGHDRAVIQRQIEATDRRIDQLVYGLYGLTDDEIKIVEHKADQ